MRRSWSFCLGAAIATMVAIVACAPATNVRPPVTKKAARVPVTGRQIKVVAPAGGIVESDGAELTIPEGALKTEGTYSVIRVTGADLEGWPQGTVVGFVFEPAGQQFRIPVLVELPTDGVQAETLCQTTSGERTIVPYDEREGDHYHFHVTELPARCAIFSAEHAAALKVARARHGEVVAKQNEKHKWAIQSELCNPNLFLRPNAQRSLEEPPGVGGCPPGMAPIPGRKVCVDRWEAHVVEVLDDGSLQSWSPFFNPGGVKIRARSAPSAFPQSYISQIQATQACVEAGKRLCTDQEWVDACRGSKKTQFPYGNTEKAGACNDRRDRHPAVEYLESGDVFAKLEHPCINQVPDTVFSTGAKSECSTPEGVFDMVGNLHEWTADPAGTFRGGYYVEAKLNGRGCDYVTTRHDAPYWDYSIGFRCCADPKPEHEGSGSIRLAPE